MRILFKLFTYFVIRLSNLYYKCLYKNYRYKYDINKTFIFNGKAIDFYGEGEISADCNSYIGSYSTIQAVKKYKVSIGKDCMISHNVRIYTSSAIADQNFSLKPLKEKYGNVKIGDAVWIGANVFINPGITIGNNAIVGANSVLTKDVPDFAIVGGVPAKIIRMKTIDIHHSE